MSKREWLNDPANADCIFATQDMVEWSVQESTKKGYRAAGKRFYNYMEGIYTQDATFPKLKDIVNTFNLLQFDILLGDYLTYKFNKTLNAGGTLNNEAAGVLYCIGVDYGVVLTSSLLPSIRRVCKGAENILLTMFGPRSRGKYPILNPILEDMLKQAETVWEQWALIVAHRFCLRSQHYCNHNWNKRPSNASDSENEEEGNHFLRVRDIRFNPSIENPTSLTIITRHDKNNPDLYHMERTVECSCNTPWTCVVHMGQRLFKNNRLPLSAALLQCRKGDMYYSAMRNIVRTCIRKIGLDPKNYGTHSLRSGGTSELFIEGRQAIYIKNFVWWRNMGSIFVYIKPNNPDLLNYAPSFVEYRKSRLRQTGLTDFIDKSWNDVWADMEKKKKKIRGSRRTQRQRVRSTFGRTGQALGQFRKMPVPVNQQRRQGQNVPAPRGQVRNMPAPRGQARNMPASIGQARNLPAPGRLAQNMPAPRGQPVRQMRHMAAPRGPPVGQLRNMPIPRNQRQRQQRKPGKHSYTDYTKIGFIPTRNFVPIVKTTVGPQSNPFRHY